MQIYLILLGFCLIINQFDNIKAETDPIDTLIEILEDNKDDDHLNDYETRGYRPAPYKLRNCIHCVGIQRKNGKNVRAATKYCNSICKRENIDDQGIETRNYKRPASPFTKCLHCVRSQRNIGTDIKTAVANHCGNVCKRELTDDDSDDDGENTEIETRRYKAEKSAPSRLRGCIHCVGEQRDKGKNVRMATKHCNNVCKREVFDEYTDDEDTEIETRRYIAEKSAPSRLRGCIHCVGEQRAKGKNVRMATKHCNNVCNREVFDEYTDDEDTEIETRYYKKAPSRLRGCIHCVGEQRAKGKNVKAATKHCNNVCKRSVFGDVDDGK